MIDINSETVIALTKVPAWHESRFGKPVHFTTLHRWRKRGVSGVKLETILAGGTRYTSHEALNRFFDAITEKRDES